MFVHADHECVIAFATFVLSAWIVFWVLAGYPLLLAWLATRRPRPVSKHFDAKTVTVLLAVHNGERWIRDKLRSLLQLDYPRELLQIVVISDGSTDGTEAAARAFAGEGVELLSIPKSGKAAALNAGMERARGEIFFFTDVRQPLERDCLRNLVACFADPQVGAACGELILRDGTTQQEMNLGLYWRYEKWMRRHLSRLDSLLVVTGCLYALRRELAVRLPEDALGDDIYLPQAAFARGSRIVFEETARAYDYPVPLHTEFGRKVRTLAGLYQYLMRHSASLLNPAGRMWIHFVSYKVGRLLLPFACLGMAVSSFALPNPWRAFLLCAQAVFCALATLDGRVPDGHLLKRFFSAPRTFLVLMAASLCATSIFFVPARSLWVPNTVGARQESPKAGNP